VDLLWREGHGASSEMRGLQGECDVDEDLYSDDEDEEREIELHAAQAERRDDLAQKPQRRIRDGVDELGHDEERAPRLPGASEDLHEVEDEAPDEDEPIEPKESGEHLPDQRH